MVAAHVAHRTQTRLLARRSFASQRERDDESGLMHFRARSYDPRTGRFMQRDPVLLTGPQTVMAYIYAENNPAVLVDPLGLYSFPPDSFCSPEVKKLVARIMARAKDRVLRVQADDTLRQSAFGQDAIVRLDRTTLLKYLTPDALSTGFEIGPEPILGDDDPRIFCITFQGKAPHLFAENFATRLRINTDVFFHHKDEDFLAATLIHEIGHMHWGLYRGEHFGIDNRRRSGILTYAPHEASSTSILDSEGIWLQRLYFPETTRTRNLGIRGISLRTINGWEFAETPVEEITPVVR